MILEWSWLLLISRITCPAQEYQSFSLVGCGVHPAIHRSSAFLLTPLEWLLYLTANPIHQPCAYLTKRFNSRSKEFIESFVRVAFEIQSLAEASWGVWLWEKVETVKRDGTFVCIPALVFMFPVVQRLTTDPTVVARARHSGAPHIKNDKYWQGYGLRGGWSLLVTKGFWLKNNKQLSQDQALIITMKKLLS